MPTDDTTAALDHASFEVVVAEGLRRATRVGADISLVMITAPTDADLRPEILASMLWLQVRTNDVVCHLGGPIFGVALDCDLEGGLIVALRLNGLLADMFEGPAWLGLVSGTGNSWTAERMLAAGWTALGRATDVAQGAIEISNEGAVPDRLSRGRGRTTARRAPPRGDR